MPIANSYFDLATALCIARAVVAFQDAAPGNITIVLDDVTFIDSSGLDAVVDAARSGRSRGVPRSSRRNGQSSPSLRRRSPQHAPARMLTITAHGRRGEPPVVDHHLGALEALRGERQGTPREAADQTGGGAARSNHQHPRRERARPTRSCPSRAQGLTRRVRHTIGLLSVPATERVALR